MYSPVTASTPAEVAAKSRSSNRAVPLTVSQMSAMADAVCSVGRPDTGGVCGGDLGDVVLDHHGVGRTTIAVHDDAVDHVGHGVEGGERGDVGIVNPDVELVVTDTALR